VCASRGQLRKHVPDEGVEQLECAVVHVDEVCTGGLLLVGDEPRGPLVDGSAARAAHLGRSGNDDNGVDLALAARLVQERDLGDGDRGVDPGQPLVAAGDDTRVE